jgi:predicted RNA-binding Zn-ribbon protein involved in translation (DUF1610 family)
MRECPRCHFSGLKTDFHPAIRQGEAGQGVRPLRVVDVGFRCPNCNEEFGFEYFIDE